MIEISPFMLGVCAGMLIVLSIHQIGTAVAMEFIRRFNMTVVRGYLEDRHERRALKLCCGQVYAMWSIANKNAELGEDRTANVYRQFASLWLTMAMNLNESVTRQMLDTLGCSEILDYVRKVEGDAVRSSSD